MKFSQFVTSLVMKIIWIWYFMHDSFSWNAIKFEFHDFKIVRAVFRLCSIVKFLSSLELMIWSESFRNIQPVRIWSQRQIIPVPTKTIIDIASSGFDFQVIRRLNLYVHYAISIQRKVNTFQILRSSILHISISLCHQYTTKGKYLSNLAFKHIWTPSQHLNNIYVSVNTFQQMVNK